MNIFYYESKFKINYFFFNYESKFKIIFFRWGGGGGDGERQGG